MYIQQYSFKNLTFAIKQKKKKPLEFSTIQYFILGTFALAFLVQLLYYLLLFIRLSFTQKNKNDKTYTPPISVVIAARNEEQNLANNLPLILAQDYPNFEVIVVNDRSWDESLDVLLAFEQQYEHLRIVDIPDVGKDGYAKKMALTLGIKAAQYDRLLLTDADCVPNSNYWIKEMAQGFAQNKMLVLGASPYQKQKGFVNKLIRFDAIMIAIQYLSMAKAKIPYMGVGRNLAYTKELYDSVRGFKNHYHIASGDDDLFVNEAAKRTNTTIVFNENAVVFSTPKSTYASWKEQKTRHLTTGGYYKGYQLFLLALFPISLALLYLSAITLSCLGIFPLHIVCLVCFKILLQLLVFRKPFNIMGSKNLIFVAPFLEVIFLFLSLKLIANSKNNT